MEAEDSGFRARPEEILWLKRTGRRRVGPGEGRERHGAVTPVPDLQIILVKRGRAATQNVGAA